MVVRDSESLLYLIHRILYHARVCSSGCTAVGELIYKYAKDIAPGELLPVATSRDLQTNFKLAVVEGVQHRAAVGKYLPAIEMPFILADGVVAPL